MMIVVEYPDDRPGPASNPQANAFSDRRDIRRLSSSFTPNKLNLEKSQETCNGRTQRLPDTNLL